jgi:hypothetical protein
MVRQNRVELFASVVARFAFGAANPLALSDKIGFIR